MKRIMLVTVMVFGIAALVFAQGGNRPGGNWTPPAGENVTVKGNLTIAQGMIAVKSGDITYLVPGLFRFVGFIDGLKDGAEVTLTGQAMGRTPDAKVKMLMPTKMIIGGKEYDMAFPRGQFRQGFGQGPGFPDQCQQQQMKPHGKMKQGQNNGCGCQCQQKGRR